MSLEVKPATRKHDIKVKAMIVDLLYFKTTKFDCVLVTSSNNGEIRFWKHTQNCRFVPETTIMESQILKWKQAQICLAWDRINLNLYCGQRNGTINMWEQKTD